MQYLSLLSAVAPMFAIMAAGYAIRRAGWLTSEADGSLLRIVINLLYPCLILHTFLGNKALEEAGNVLLAPVVGFATVAGGYLLSYLAAPLFGVSEPRERRTFAFTTGIYNYIYIALPIIQTLFNNDGAQDRTTGVLLIHNVGVEAALWTVGIMVLTGASPRDGIRKLVNVPLLAICAALLLHFCHARQWLPAFLLSAIQSLALTAIPLGLLLTGATFADQAKNARQPSAGAAGVGAVLLRLSIFPLCFLLLARYLPCPIELRRVIIVQAAMPCGVIPVILAKHYGGDGGMALRIVLITTIIALFTIPLWLRFGLWFCLPAQ